MAVTAGGPRGGDGRTRFGPYQVVRELGRGGMGIVLEAVDERTGRKVAIKHLHALASERTRARLEREARALASLEHPGIARLHEAVLEPDAPYLVFELVVGRTLEQMIDDQRLDPLRAVDLVLEVARAVAAAHAGGFIHRDLKPGNVIVRFDGRPVVLDFGLARGEDETTDLTRTGNVLGTPGFLAPEQVDDARRAGPAADVYGIGATLYACLTGRAPFMGAGAFRVAQTRTERPAPPSVHAPAVPASLDALVLRCLEKDPARRPADAGALALELEAWRRQASQAAPGDSRRGVLAGLALVASAVLAVAFVVARTVRPTGDLPVAGDGRSDLAPDPPTTPVGAGAPAASSSATPPAATPPAATPPAATSPAATPPAATPPSAADVEEARRLLDRAMALGARFAEAEALCTQAITLAPSDEAYAMRGFRRFSQGNHAGAVADYERAIELAPKLASHHRNLGVNLARLARHAEAVEAYERAIAREPEHSGTYVLIGECLADAGEHEQARAALERALARAPRNARALQALARAFGRLGDHERAIALASAAIELAPQDPASYTDRAAAESRLGRHADALRDCDHALTLAPGHVEARLRRAAARYGLGDLEAARADLEAFLGARPGDPEARRLLDGVERAITARDERR